MTIGYEHPKPPWTVGDMALACAICLGAFGVFLLAVGGLSLADRPNADLSRFAWLAAIAESVLVVSVWLIIAKKYSLPWSVVGVRLPSRGSAFALSAAALLGSLTFTGAYSLVVSALELDALTPEPLPAELAGEGVAMLITAIALCVWVPFVEEIFFRGFLFAGIAARFGLYAGVTVSAILFALVHFSLATIIPIFVTGMLFALVYRATKSIWIPIVAHSAQNLIALIASRYAMPEIGNRVGDGLAIM